MTECAAPERQQARAKVRLAHVCAGRLRLVFRDQRGDAEFFERLEQALAAVPGAIKVMSRPSTGSVIISCDEDPHELLAKAVSAGLFDIVPPDASPAPSISDLLRAEVDRIDARLKADTGGSLDVSSLSILALVSYGFVQLARGRVGISALSAFWYAINVLLMTRRRENVPPSQSPPQ